MKIAKDELITVLAQFNPWWRDQTQLDLPSWHRAAFNDLFKWVSNPPAPRAILLSGARQIGKTTLLRQAIQQLLKQGVPESNILYTTFDHPLIKLAGIDAVLDAWRERHPKAEGLEYLFLDEAQFIRDWGTWIKHQVDFNKNRRIIFTGSAMPLLRENQESGVGRWHTIRLSTLSFYEYVQLKSTSSPSLRTKLQLTPLPNINSLRDLQNCSENDFKQISDLGTEYTAHFHEYLARGGFPQTALVENINEAQRLLREDIIDKVLKRDMTALFGVRNILELEQTFLYLCMNDGGLLDIPKLCENLELKRPTVQRFIDILEAAHLIYRLPPFGYGKDVLRGKFKIYLADPAMSPAVLLKGSQMLDDPQVLGRATETAVFKHLYSHYYKKGVRFAYWQNKKNQEVDVIAEIGEQRIPFEVKYRTTHTGKRDLKGLLELCENKEIHRAYVVTKSISDFGLLEHPSESKFKILCIPAALLCYWMGSLELVDDEV